MLLCSAAPVARKPLPAAVAAAPVATSTFGALLEDAPRFDVAWSADATHATLVPITPAASALAADPAAARRLAGIADAIAGTVRDGGSRLARIAFSGSEDAFVAARLLPRVEGALAEADEGDHDLGQAVQLVEWVAPALAAQGPDAEFVPAANEVVIGPSASTLLLHPERAASRSAATDTRAAYVLRHELAHAAQPVAPASLVDRQVHLFEEGRADLVARADPGLGEFAARLGLAFDAEALRQDGTYHVQRGLVGVLLQAGGLQPRSPEARQLLAQTPGEQVAGALAARIGARTGIDPDHLRGELLGATDSLRSMRELLGLVGISTEALTGDA